MPASHCADNAADRKIGELWERNFCKLAARRYKAFTPHQIGRQKAASWCVRESERWKLTLLPDIAVWTAPGEHHEIKHKKPTDSNCFGLEVYRLDALVEFRQLTKQPVLYTIHDWGLAGALKSNDDMPNLIEHWRTVDVMTLDIYVTEHDVRQVLTDTWVNGQKTKRPLYYWPTSLWKPLDLWWEQQAQADCA